MTLPPFASAAPAQNDLWGEGWPEVRGMWPLEPSVDHLNHGSFGAVPTAVLEEQQSWRTRMEENPVRFFRRDLGAALDEARSDVARFLGADGDGLVFVRNATSGVSTVLASFPLAPDDEVLLTDHSYGAVLLAAERFAGLAGARAVVAGVPLEADDDELVEAVLAAVTTRTRLAILDDITSATARRLPLDRLIPALHEREVVVLVDAAHAPGMVEIDLATSGADYWTGNLHKWSCAPRGSAVLWVELSRRAEVRPLVASWTERLGYPRAFDEQGSDDYTGWLAAPRALRLLAGLGWDKVRRHNADLASLAQARVAAALGLEPPESRPGMSMQLVRLPGHLATTYEEAWALQTAIADEIGVEVPGTVRALVADGALGRKSGRGLTL